MKSLCSIALVICMALSLTETASAQSDAEVITIPLSQPGERMTLDISILSARIEVIGEDRADAEFAVSVEQSSRRIVTPSGTKSISAGAYALEVDEEDNYVSVDTDWRTDKVNIVARIPRNADLELSTTNDGEIIVSNINGNLQLNNVNGPISAREVSGSVIAETINEDILISFASLDDNNATSLSTLNGDLRLALPAGTGAELHIDSAKGEIYSDFEVDVRPSKPVVQRREDRGGMEVRVESVIVAAVNGGGPIVKMKTLHGGIQIQDNSQ